MNLRRALGTVAGLALAAAGMAALSGPAWAAPPFATPTTCTFQTVNTGNYLTAVGGGGRTTDVIHSDATVARSWERFTLVDAGDGVHVGIKTLTGNYLTAVNGGGLQTDVLHSDATLLRAWEKFALVRQGGDGFAIQTVDGHFLTAVGGGNRTTDVVHSDATQARAWELFRVQCDLTTVPNVQGFGDGGARNAIAGAGLTVGSVTFDNTCVDVFGTVLFSSPGAGATVPRGSAVNLRESSGRDASGRPCVLK
ncbi:PASTA domain-containing protein [Nonomuraea sp. WAC 01424]|uniref:PASTA domain-containing protein n=1 Tax=Nonomuraea sp. WAC 01424 TaxID=2203200 RepID=UPI00163B9390|nr:PASTA domain-containing protein [Nonomuraea sp. WAC 01424]